MNGKKPEDYEEEIDTAVNELANIHRDYWAVEEVFENWKSDRAWVGQLQDEVAKLHAERFRLEAEIRRLKR